MKLWPQRRSGQCSDAAAAAQKPAAAPGCASWADDDWPILDPYEAVHGGFNLVFAVSDARIFSASLLDSSHLWTPLLGPRDAVIFSDPWASRLETAKAAQAGARFPENLFFLCNDWQSYYRRKPVLCNVALVNQNSFIDETRFVIREGAPKRFDALYTARRAVSKRHHLAAAVGAACRLALIYPHHDERWSDLPLCRLPRHVYANKSNIEAEVVCDIINQSRVGLALSAVEGACFASSEYLLCGVPVVSTPSKGGRSFWYDDENALIVDADPDAVLAGVREILQAERDPRRIRAAHLERMRRQRRTLRDETLAPIAVRFGLADWDYGAAFQRCDLAAEFAFRKDCWLDLDGIRRALSV